MQIRREPRTKAGSKIVRKCSSAAPNIVRLFGKVRLYLKGINYQCCVVSPLICTNLACFHIQVPFFIFVGFSGPICMNSLQGINIFISYTKKINESKIKREPFCFWKKKTNNYVTKPKIFELLISTHLQYSLNISANISSNFMILYIFQQPTDWAVEKWTGLILRVL